MNKIFDCNIFMILIITHEVNWNFRNLKELLIYLLYPNCCNGLCNRYFNNEKFQLKCANLFWVFWSCIICTPFGPIFYIKLKRFYPDWDWAKHLTSILKLQFTFVCVFNGWGKWSINFRINWAHNQHSCIWNYEREMMPIDPSSKHENYIY